MGLSLLGPLFLTGLAALTVPVLVHLVRRSDAVVRKFPSLMFLSRIFPYHFSSGAKHRAA